MFVQLPASRAIRAVEATIFHANGSRTVMGTLGSVTYDAEGNATVCMFVVPAKGDHLRTDLGEAA